MRDLISTALTRFTTHAYFPLLDRAKRMPVSSLLDEAKSVERLPTDDLRRLQLAKARHALEHAERYTRYYAERFRHCGFRPADMTSLEAFEVVPLLTKEDVFAHRREMQATEIVGARLRASTSGSTGIALQFEFDSFQYAWVIASVWRGRGWWGVRRGDREFALWARPVKHTWWSDRSTWAKYRLRNSIQFDAFANFDEERIIRSLHSARPKYIYGYGSSVGRLAEALARRGMALGEGERPIFVEYTGDHMYESERTLAEKVFGAPVLSAYGASECGGVAQQCREGRLHVSVDHVLVEFLREDGARADPGDVARIVVTQLNNAAMPLIRYAIGDMGSYSNEPCPCGVTLPIMTLAVGKTADVITTSTKSGVSAYLLDYVNIHLMKNGIRGIKQYMVVQTALDSFTVRFVKESPFDQASVDTFLAKMREYLGETIELTVEFVPNIPVQKTGKRRYFLKAFGEEREASAS